MGNRFGWAKLVNIKTDYIRWKNLKNEEVFYHIMIINIPPDYYEIFGQYRGLRIG